MSLPIASFGLPVAPAQEEGASEKRNVPVPIRVGPLTRRGGRLDVFLAADAGPAAPAVFFAASEATAAVKH